MATKYSKQMILDGPIGGVFELCCNYFTGEGYSQVQSYPPREIFLKKKGTLWTFDEIDVSHIVEIRLQELNQFKTHASFDFKVDSIWAAGDWSPKSVSEVNRMLMNLTMMATSKYQQPQSRGSQVLEREKIIEREIVVKIKCRYCGALNLAVDQKCTSCGANL